MATALIVEDNPDQATLAAELVRLRAFQPFVAATGEDGMAMARALQPDLILLDLMLPDVNGFDVCLRLRREPQTRTTPIVMVTALGDDRNRQRGFRVGANAYVTKPYGAEDLYDAIEEARSWRARLTRSRLKGEIHVELNSETRFLHDVNEFLTDLCRETPLNDNQVAQIRQAILELGTNAIEWGNRHQVEELVLITYRVFDDRVEVVVKDQGPGYDPRNLPHAAQSDDPIAHMDVREKLGIREGGFGLLISKGMVDELHHNEIGNEVTLIKRFDSANPDREPNGQLLPDRDQNS